MASFQVRSDFCRCPIVSPEMRARCCCCCCCSSAGARRGWPRHIDEARDSREEPTAAHEAVLPYQAEAMGQYSTLSSMQTLQLHRISYYILNIFYTIVSFDIAQKANSDYADRSMVSTVAHSNIIHTYNTL